jgi:hypothetical protein
MNVFGESVIVGIICLIVGTVVFTIVDNFGLDNSNSPRFRSYHEQLALFLTGFLGHLFFEYTGMNERLHRWTGVWLW